MPVEKTVAKVEEAIIPEKPVMAEPKVDESIKVEPAKVEPAVAESVKAEEKKEEPKTEGKAEKKFHGQVIAVFGDKAFVKVNNNTWTVNTNGAKVGQWIDF